MPELLYFGHSMRPLFRVGDALRVEPCGAEEIRVGEVVVFYHPRSGRRLVHRVAAITREGLLTKGDNSPELDPWLLRSEEILGRVIAICRDGRLLPVPRQAPPGLKWLKARKWAERRVSRLLHPIYQGLAASRVFRKGLASWIRPRLLAFSRTDGMEWQLWWGRLLIGRKTPKQSEWSIRRPFRLLVDPAALPGKNQETEILGQAAREGAKLVRQPQSQDLAQ